MELLARRLVPKVPLFSPVLPYPIRSTFSPTLGAVEAICLGVTPTTSLLSRTTATSDLLPPA